MNDLRRERLQSSTRNPGAAALMSFFVMGMGQIYAGHIDRGIMLMGFHFSGIFAAYSLYYNGLLYEMIFPYLGAHLLVMFCYVASVFFILLWIYNIKDAYYLSLFSSVRDWFEVERVLLPMLKELQGCLLTGPYTGNELLEDNGDSYDSEPTPVSEPALAAESVARNVDAEVTAVAGAASVASSAEDAEEADVLEFRIDRKTQPKKLEKRRQEEKSETAHVVSGRDFEAVSAYGSSWRLYAGLITIFVLVGIWFNNRQVGNNTVLQKGSATLFTVSADLGKNAKVGATDSVQELEPIPAVSQQVEPASAAEVLTSPVETASTDDIVSPPATDTGSELAAKVPADTETASQSPAVVEAANADEPPFMKGLELVQVGSFAEAATLFAADLQRAEPSEDTWKSVLNAFYRADNKVAYEMNLRRYLKKYSSDATAWLNLGKLLYDRNELAQAAQAIVSGLKTEPDNVRGNFLLGSIYSDLKLYDDSATYLTRAVAFEPLNLEFNRQLARALAAAGKPEEAAKYYQRVISLVPDDREARQGIAAARPEMAMAFNANETDENQVLVMMGKTESRLVEKSNVEMPVQQTGKVLFEAAAGADSDLDSDIDTAAVTEMVKVEPEVQSQIVELKTPVAKASTKMAIVEPVAAEPQTESAVDSRSKGSGLSDVEAGTAVVKPANKDELRDAIASAEEKKKQAVPKANRIEEFRQKGSYEFSRGNWEAALPHYLNILKEKKDAQTYDIVGLIFEKLSMSHDAFEAVEHAYQLGMRDSSTLAKLGRLAEMNGDFKKGEYYLYHALQKVPHRVDLRIRYARCLEANGRQPYALKELEKIVRASGDSYAVRRRAELEMQKIKSKKQ